MSFYSKHSDVMLNNIVTTEVVVCKIRLKKYNIVIFLTYVYEYTNVRRHFGGEFRRDTRTRLRTVV